MQQQKNDATMINEREKNKMSEQFIECDELELDRCENIPIKSKYNYFMAIGTSSFIEYEHIY